MKLNRGRTESWEDGSQEVNGEKESSVEDQRWPATSVQRIMLELDLMREARTV